MIASYFEVLDAADLPILIDRLELTGAEQATLAAGGAVPDSYADMIELLLGNHYRSLKLDACGAGRRQLARLAGGCGRFLRGRALPRKACRCRVRW